MKTAIIFGGTGFIGTFVAKSLIKNKIVERVYLADIELLEEKQFKFRKEFLKGYEIHEIRCDVRKGIEIEVEEKVDIVFNFAAVHREPGHLDEEYYETNIKGAENVCKWAEINSVETIVFTSSIAPYGTREIEKTEETLPVPTSAYGGSKLCAEEIHKKWAIAGGGPAKKLIICRPGVVFGPTEGGNVSRLIKAVNKNYFLFMGNQQTKKAGIYVNELVNMMLWSVSYAKKSENNNIVLFNMVMQNSPTIEDYVKEVKKINQINLPTPSIPYIFIII